MLYNCKDTTQKCYSNSYCETAKQIMDVIAIGITGTIVTVIILGTYLNASLLKSIKKISLHHRISHQEYHKILISSISPSHIFNQVYQENEYHYLPCCSGYGSHGSCCPCSRRTEKPSGLA